MESRDPKAARRLAAITIFQVMLLAVMMAAITTVVVVGSYRLSGTSDLGSFWALIFFGPVLVVLSVLVTPQIVMRRTRRRNENLAIRPLGDGAVIGGGLALWLVALTFAFSGDRTGSSGVLSGLSLVCWLVAVPVGLFALWELLSRRWSKGSGLAAAIAGFSFFGLVLVAAVPAILVSSDNYRNLPIAVIDETKAAEEGWQVFGVENYAPRPVRMGLEKDGRSVIIWLRHNSNGCDEQYLCASVGTAADGSTILAQSRVCRDDKQEWPNLLIDRPNGHWAIQSDSVTSFCKTEAPNVTMEDLLEVANLIEPATSEEFQTFADRYS